MPDLQTIQTSMSAAILSGDMSTVAGWFGAAGASAERRLNIYRNNTLVSLTECLKAVFPVTVKLSDQRFFSYAAHEFITRYPPTEARLAVYGAGFPRFLAAFDACRGFPILAQMAALEWAIFDSFGKPEQAAVDLAFAAEALASGRMVCLALQPNLSFAVSRWPILDVWLDHQKEPVVIRGPLKPRWSRVAVITRGEDMECVEIDSARFAFWRSLTRGACLEHAGAKALRQDRLFDLVNETVLLFRSRLVTGVFTTCNKDN